jgi:hypothetical protein
VNGYEKIIKIMQSQTGSSDNIFIAIMDSSRSCTVNGLKLTSTDLLIAEHLTTGWYKDAYTQIEPLKQGDTVVVVRLSETKYAILERVV